MFPSLILLLFPSRSDHIRLRGYPRVRVHLSIWTSKAGHIQAEPARRRRGIQTETDHSVSL